MKKVKSMGKKVMSVGLAASLLLVPVGANKCFAAKEINNEQARQAEGNKSSGTDLGSLWVAFFALLFVGKLCYDYNNPETVKKATEMVSAVCVKGAGLVNSNLGSRASFGEFIRNNKNALFKFIREHLGEDIIEKIIKDVECMKILSKQVGIDMTNFVEYIATDLRGIAGVFYRMLNTIGFKNIFSAIGVGYAAKKALGYVTRKACSITKWGYNKVVGLFKSEAQEDKEYNEPDNGLTNEYSNFEINDNNRDEYEAAWERIMSGY